MSSFDEDGVGATIIGGNSDCFVEESMKVFDANGFIKEAVEMFHADSFMVAASSNMEVDIQNCTDFLEEAFESAAVVDDDQTAKTDF